MCIRDRVGERADDGSRTDRGGARVRPDDRGSRPDAVVGAGATVLRSHACAATIGAGAVVGPFSYLRPGTDLGASGKIGAFVETKNASIGAGSKVPHLSYCLLYTSPSPRD